MDTQLWVALLVGLGGFGWWMWWITGAGVRWWHGAVLVCLMALTQAAIMVSPNGSLTRFVGLSLLLAPGWAVALWLLWLLELRGRRRTRR